MITTTQQSEQIQVTFSVDKEEFEQVRRIMTRLTKEEDPAVALPLTDEQIAYTIYAYGVVSQSSSEHQPAARGGGERIKVELINGVEGQCVAVNDYRICGPKPWGGGSIAKSWTTDKNDILRAFLTLDQKHAWLADDLQVVSVNQHQSLVAERESLILTIKNALEKVFNDGRQPDGWVQIQQSAIDELRTVVQSIE